MTELETRIEELKISMEQMTKDYFFDDIVRYLAGNTSDIELSPDRLQELIEVKRIYDLGLKFAKNQQGNFKRSFMNTTKEGALIELDMIKTCYSRATYYRYKKLFKEVFGAP
jgi:hypothetical protein